MSSEYGKVSARTFEHMKKGVTFMSNYHYIDNIYALPRLGSGHDGFVFQYGDYALKLLKYDIDTRTKSNLMTFEKASYFTKNMKLKRIETPVDVLLDEDGIFSGYAMRYIVDLSSKKFKGSSRYKDPGQFTCGDLLWAVEELGDDFSQLSDKGVAVKDINNGSFLFPVDYVHLCDTDKYFLGGSFVDSMNKVKYNYAIARLLYLEMMRGGFSKEELRQLNVWVKHMSNSRSFTKDLVKEIGSDFNEPIREFALQKAKTILR